MSRLSQRYRFVEGLGEDMVGYLFPKTNAVGVPRTLDGADDTDRFGCGHSDDGEAAADDAGGIVARHLAALLPADAGLDRARPLRVDRRHPPPQPARRGRPGVHRRRRTRSCPDPAHAGSRSTATP